MAATSGADPVAAAAPNFCTKLAAGMIVSLIWTSFWLALYVSTMLLMKLWSLSRAHRLMVPVPLPLLPPTELPQPAARLRLSATTEAVRALMILRLSTFDRLSWIRAVPCLSTGMRRAGWFSGLRQPDPHRISFPIRPGVVGDRRDVEGLIWRRIRAGTAVETRVELLTARAAYRCL